MPAGELLADQAAADGSELAELDRYNAELLGYWSDMVGDMRGRRRRGTRFYEHAPPGVDPADAGRSDSTTSSAESRRSMR